MVLDREHESSMTLKARRPCINSFGKEPIMGCPKGTRKA